MPEISLPCTLCGASLPIRRGSTVQCFACGTKNIYMESFELLSQFVLGLGISKVIEEIEPTLEEKWVTERMNAVDKAFNEYLGLTRQVEYIIVTKLDPHEFPKNFQDLGKKTGLLSIVIEDYLLPHMANSLQKQQYSEMQSMCTIRNAILTGLWMSFEAQKSFEPQKAQQWYIKAQQNYSRAKDYAVKYATQTSVGFEEEKMLASAAEKFCGLLHDFITNNPAYYADELEQIEIQLKDITDPRGLLLKKQVKIFYDLGTVMMFVLDEFRQSKPFEALQLTDERILFYTQEIKEKFEAVKHWIEELDARFTASQNKLMILHGGKRTKYLEDYLHEFQLKFNETKRRHNDLIAHYVAATLSDYAIEVSDDFELLDMILDDPDFVPQELTERFEKAKFQILVLEEAVKSFIEDISKMALGEDLAKTHSLELITGLSEKHAVFDRKALKGINILIERFIIARNNQHISIEDQKSLFTKDYLPFIEALVQEGFTLKIEDIPLPLFIELIILTTKLEIEIDYRVVLLIENPSPVTLQNVGVSFFVPNSFRIKTRLLDIGKLRPHQKIKAETNVIPTKEGKYNLMAMVNYTHINESFWLPSLTIPLIVGNIDQQDEVLMDLYKKYGVDPKAIDLIKSFDDMSNNLEIEKQKSAENDTVEKENLRKIIKDVENLEDSIDNEEKSGDEEPDQKKEEKQN